MADGPVGVGPYDVVPGKFFSTQDAVGGVGVSLATQRKAFASGNSMMAGVAVDHNAPVNTIGVSPNLNLQVLLDRLSSVEKSGTANEVLQQCVETLVEENRRVCEDRDTLQNKYDSLLERYLGLVDRLAGFLPPAPGG